MKETHTKLDCIRREMVRDGVLDVSPDPYPARCNNQELTLMTLNSFSEPLTPLMLSLWSNWTIISLLFTLDSEGDDSPIKPENRLNVLGILTLGLTSIKTPLAVWM